MLFGRQIFPQLYRKLRDGVNPGGSTPFPDRTGAIDNVPHSAAQLNMPDNPTHVVCFCRTVTSEADAWTMTLDHVGRYYEPRPLPQAELQMKPRPLVPG